MNFRGFAALFLISACFLTVYGVSLIYSKYDQLQSAPTEMKKRNLISEITHFKRSSISGREWEIYASKAFVYADKSIELANFAFKLLNKNHIYSIAGESAALVLSDTELSNFKAEGNISIIGEEHNLKAFTQVLTLVDKSKALMEQEVLVELPNVLIKSLKAEINFAESKVSFSGNVWSKINH